MGDLVLLKLINNIVTGYSSGSSSTYSLSAATGFVALAGSVLTLTNPQYFGTGNIGENTLVGTPSFGTGSNLGSSPAAVAAASALHSTLIGLTGFPLGATPLETNGPTSNGIYTPGVYTTAAGINMTAANSITLSGAGDYVFISTGGAIVFGANDNVILSGGAQSSNVYWVANNAITVGANDNIVGNLMSGPTGAITIGSTVNLVGRMLSYSAITIDGTASTFVLPSGSGSSSGASSTIIGLNNIDAIPSLWFEIQGVTGNSVTVDRKLPNYSADTNESIIIVYKGGEVYNTIATGNTTSYWDSGTLSFDASNNINCSDFPVWNMNNVWCENLAGMTGLTGSSYYEDYTKFGSYPYLGTKNPYLEYFCMTTANTLSFNCNGPGYSYPDDVSKSISIIHYTNNTISSNYGEFLYIDNSNNKTLTLYLPDLLYNRSLYPTGSGTTGGMSFIASGDTQHIGTSNIEYVNLIENPVYISSGTTALVVGKVFPQLKIVVIDNDEIVAALSYKSNRNWTLPALAATLTSPSGGTSSGILPIDSTMYLTYSLENTSSTGLTTSLPCQEYIKITNNTLTNKDVSFTISATDLLPYMRKIENVGYDGFGFYANKFRLLYQIVTDPNTRPDPGSWLAYDFTSTAITTTTGATIDPKLLENQIPAVNGFTIDLIKNASATIFDITQSLNMAPNNKPQWLQFGDERFFYGNLTTFIGATIFKTIFDFRVNSGMFNQTSNPTMPSTNPPNIKVSEIGIYDNNYNLVIIGKLSTPVSLEAGSTVMFELGLDF